MKQHSEITAQTRQNLIDAFWQLYCIKRIEKITVKEITTKAGYNRGTFYEYFKDVYDILEQIENSILPHLSAHHHPNLLQEPDVMQHINHFVEIYQERSKYYVVLLGDNGDPSFQGKIRNTISPVLKRFFSTHSTVDNFILDYTIEYAVSAIIGVLNYGFRRENNPPIEKLLQLIYSLMYDGVMKRLI